MGGALARGHYIQGSFVIWDQLLTNSGSLSPIGIKVYVWYMSCWVEGHKSSAVTLELWLVFPQTQPTN